MTSRIVIDPVTRLEGHGRIDIHLDDSGDVTHTFFQVPDFKGFEKFCQGRAVEELPTLTQKICGVCPTAHHIASVKALDQLFGVSPPRAASVIRELMHMAFVFEDHLLHFFYLGGPDILINEAVLPYQYNVFGALEAVGREMGDQAIRIRKKVRDLHARISGSALYPVCGLPGGVSLPVPAASREAIRKTANEALAFARQAMAYFHKEVARSDPFKKMCRDAIFSLATFYMGMVDEQYRLNLYDGNIRVVSPSGDPFACFPVERYLDQLQERTVAGTYMKHLFLKQVNGKGKTERQDSGLYRVGPLARLNAAEGLSTPLAQEEYDRFYDTIGEKPAHNTLLYHWARLIEILYAAERMVQLAHSDALTDPHVRNMPPGRFSTDGVGACEAPRGTLIHHYQIDSRAIVQGVNLLVATQNNSAAICLSIDKVAKTLIKNGKVTDDLLHQVEMAYRAYDPCLACATH